MMFRIGINLGNVTEVGGKIYGHAVNVASRLEGLATAGSICISGDVYDLVKKKLPLQYECLAEQMLKNIAEPMFAYRIHPKSSSTKSADSATRPVANGWKITGPKYRCHSSERNSPKKTETLS